MLPKAVEIRPFALEDAGRVSALVRDVFDEHVSPTFEPEGIAEFHAHATPEALVERAATPTTSRCFSCGPHTWAWASPPR